MSMPQVMEANMRQSCFLKDFSKGMAGNEDFPFRGNIDLECLESLLENERHRVPLVYITVTNNTGGGQPVSLENIQKARNIAHKYGVPIFFDACRFAENAWFIKQLEKQYKDFSIASIVKEMFECVDGFTISFKKDGLANMGGSLLIKDDGFFNKAYPDAKDRLTNFQILAEGHPTYGGLAGRDLKALAEGLKTITRQDYLEYRIKQVERFGLKLLNYDIPIMRPIGGHAIYIDMDQFKQLLEKYQDEVGGGVQGAGSGGVRLVPEAQLLAAGREEATCGYTSKKLLRTVVDKWHKTEEEVVPPDEKTSTKGVSIKTIWARDIYKEWEVSVCSLPQGHSGDHHGTTTKGYTLEDTVTEELSYSAKQKTTPPKPHFTDELPVVDVAPHQIIPSDQDTPDDEAITPDEIIPPYQAEED